VITSVNDFQRTHVDGHFNSNDRDLKKSEATLRKMALVNDNLNHSSVRINFVKKISNSTNKDAEKIK
jgi:hypothetical protein